MLVNQHVRFGERVTGDPHMGQPLPTRPQEETLEMDERPSATPHQLRLPLQ